MPKKTLGINVLEAVQNGNAGMKNPKIYGWEIQTQFIIGIQYARIVHVHTLKLIPSKIIFI